MERENSNNSWMFEMDESGYVLPVIKTEPEHQRSFCGENLKRGKIFLSISNARGLHKNN